jgi:hypothetical protein
MPIARAIPLLPLLALLSACSSLSSRPPLPASSRPATVWDDPATLVQVRAELAAGAGPSAALAALTHKADDALTLRTPSVMDKATPGPSGDKHDYVSYAPYFWPNPDTQDGLPYVRHDGHRNQAAVSNGDANALEHMHSAVHTLGLAYWYTRNPAYAQKAAELMRVWYVNPDTRMTPTFQYAQAILGVNDGRGIGLIENRAIVRALDGVALIADSGAWTENDQTALHAWVAAFDHWLTTSQRGLEEKAAKNNHGSWYAVQEAGLYLWLGKTAQARQVFEAAKTRIAQQIQPNGRELLEIVREDGFSYSVFNVQALSTLANMAQRNGVDLWHYQNEARGLQQAIDYLMPFANGSEKWTDKHLKRIDADGLAPVVAEAVKQYGDAKYAAWLAPMKKDLAESEWLLTGG